MLQSFSALLRVSRGPRLWSSTSPRAPRADPASKSNGDIAGMAGEEESAGEGSKMKPTLSGRQVGPQPPRVDTDVLNH